jgi:hypothetical protein
MPVDPEQAYARLYTYCESQDFAGYDPFDGLNSRLFQLTPLKRFRGTRLAWLQLIKRSPFDLRQGVEVQKGVNAKALALFALAEIALYRSSREDQHRLNAESFLERLLSMKIEGKTAEDKKIVAFGYNFDWQSRSFFAPRGTPAVVPTAFAQQAFFEAFEAFGKSNYLYTAMAICEFIVRCLKRPVETVDELCFSYTPLDRSAVYNASLLAGECLARVGAITDRTDYLELAAKTARFVLRRQRSDGAWNYGESKAQMWVDNFHTAYVLLSIKRIGTHVPEIAAESSAALERGTRYWLENFFLEDGTPKYYDNSVYPVDIHSAAAAIVTLCELGEQDEQMTALAKRAAEWTIDNMFDPRGFFYYQIRRRGTVKTPYMRWGQAWMAYSLAGLIESEKRSPAAA